MRMHYLIKPTLLTALLCLGLSACCDPESARNTGTDMDGSVIEAEHPPDTAGDKLQAGRDEAQEQLSDGAITTKVKAALLADSDVASLNIEVNTVAGVVTLTGDVQTLAIREKVSEIAKAISDVKEVSNQLKIKA